jgi:hypothetical protein
MRQFLGGRGRVAGGHGGAIVPRELLLVGIMSSGRAQAWNPGRVSVMEDMP